MRVKFSQAARSRHRVAPSRARHVMATNIGRPITTVRGKPGVLWIGADRDGNVLQVVAAVEPDRLVVTHVMPYRWKEHR